MNIDTTVHEECNVLDELTSLQSVSKRTLSSSQLNFLRHTLFNRATSKSVTSSPQKKKRALRVLATRQRIKTYTQKLEIV